MKRRNNPDELADRIIAEIIAEEQHFAASVKAGDTVAWVEWVWERGITGNPLDPETSEQVTFAGMVDRVERGTLYVLPESVTPSAAEVRQRPRLYLPVSAFHFPHSEA